VGGAGTNGQSLTNGVVVGLSKQMNRILDIDVLARRVRVQAGVVKDQLNAALKPHGLFFAPELSTSNRATIGGMVSTDASGQGSCTYGKARDHVMALDFVYRGGERHESAPVPSERTVSVRISATDWVDGGFNLEEAIAFSKMLEARGVDVIHVSSGGLHPDQAIAIAPGYQVPLARAVKAAVGIPVVAVGLITEPTHAEAIVANGDADLVAIARTVLYDPRWPWHAAAALGGQVRVASQYLRCRPAQYRELFRS